MYLVTHRRLQSQRDQLSRNVFVVEFCPRVGFWVAMADAATPGVEASQAPR